MFVNQKMVFKSMAQIDDEDPNKRDTLTFPNRANKSTCIPIRSSLRNQIRLVLLMLGLAGIWLVALPWIARQPQMAAHLHWLEEQGIDGGAMYYTELEAMEPILERLERRR